VKKKRARGEKIGGDSEIYQSTGFDSNLKYLSRCQYYGKLVDWEYPEGTDGLVLKFSVFTSTPYYSNRCTIRIYVPSDREDYIHEISEIGEEYLIIAAPYKIRMSRGYPHRVDLLLEIGKLY